LNSDATLFGAATSPTKKIPGFFGAIRYLRKRLDLYANVRPAKYHPVPGSVPGTDLVVVRENTEGLYVEQERLYARGKVAIADRVITYEASYRIAEYALKLAERRKGKLALVHKANVLPFSSRPPTTPPSATRPSRSPRSSSTPAPCAWFGSRRALMFW